MPSISTNSPTAELQALDAAHHLHPFSAQGEFHTKGARVITRAEGAWLTDSDGERILDGMAGLWCVNIGYGRHELAAAAERQMRELPYYNTFFKTTHVPAIQLASRLADLVPGDLNHTFFSSSGSEANDTNLRLVRRYWELKGKPEKTVFIARKNGYHGSSMGSASLGGMQAMHAQGGLPIPDIHHINQPNWYAEGGEMSPEEFGLARARELEQAIHQIGEGRVAAFIAEPIQGAGGVIIPPETYWPEIQRICDAHEILLIVDEVICGFGRTGNWFGHQTLNIKPDMITIAKGLSSGYQPIGGSVVSDEIAEVLGRDEFAHGYTYSGHPVACAVALENLRIMEEEGIVDHVGNVAGPYLKTKWEALADHPLVGEAKISGMMASVALTPHAESRAKFASDPGTIGNICRDFCFANNLVMRAVGDRMVVSPPLILNTDEIDTMIERVVQSLDQTLAMASEEGLMKAAN